jgi:ABC-type oligopeptide transport system ATPase subunit
LNLLIKLREEFKFTKGKIEEMGIADEIYNNPQQEYTKKLIAAIPKGNLADIKARFERV